VSGLFAWHRAVTVVEDEAIMDIEEDNADQVSAFQIGDACIFTIKNGDELILSGVAESVHKGRECCMVFGDVRILCSVDSTNSDPEKVGVVEGQTRQTRFTWKGKVIQMEQYTALPKHQQTGYQESWDLERLQHEYTTLQRMYNLSMATVESLKPHEDTTMRLVGWFRENMPEKFDASGQYTMGQIAVGVLQDYIILRGHYRDRGWRAWRAWWRRLWRRDGRDGRNDEWCERWRRVEGEMEARKGERKGDWV
jgi:hypothetical protein